LNCQRRRREREELWVEYGCEEREDLETKKAAELEKMTQAQRIKWNEDMTEQLRLLELKKKAMKEEELNERLWVKYAESVYLFRLSINPHLCV
jgi:hypothetical protein